MQSPFLVIQVPTSNIQAKDTTLRKTFCLQLTYMKMKYKIQTAQNMSFQICRTQDMLPHFLRSIVRFLPPRTPLSLQAGGLPLPPVLASPPGFNGSPIDNGHSYCRLHQVFKWPWRLPPCVTSIEYLLVWAAISSARFHNAGRWKQRLCWTSYQFS